MTSADAVVVCRDAARTYGRGERAVVAVHGLCCEVRRGDRIALSGPSGSGKSTVLHMLAGLVPPTAGTVTWPAIGDASRLQPEHVSVVFQGPTLIPALTVAENVALPRVIAGEETAAATREAAPMLAALGLDGLGDRYPEELSAGQAQRAATARAMVGTPALILADEPTGQLDRRTAEVVVDALVQRADVLDAALVVATHDERITRRLRTRWTIRDGRLDQEDGCSP